MELSKEFFLRGIFPFLGFLVIIHLIFLTYFNDSRTTLWTMLIVLCWILVILSESLKCLAICFCRDCPEVIHFWIRLALPFCQDTRHEFLLLKAHLPLVNNHLLPSVCRLLSLRVSALTVLLKVRFAHLRGLPRPLQRVCEVRSIFSVKSRSFQSDAKTCAFSSLSWWYRRDDSTHLGMSELKGRVSSNCWCSLCSLFFITTCSGLENRCTKTVCAETAEINFITSGLLNTHFFTTPRWNKSVPTSQKNSFFSEKKNNHLLDCVSCQLK